MADRRVRAILEVDYQGEQDVLKAQTDLRGVDGAASGAKGGLGGVTDAFGAIAGVAVAAGAGLVVAQKAFSALSDAIMDGAALDDLRDDFESLATTAGMSADKLIAGISQASGGLITSAEAMAAASELINLNLGLTEDQITTLIGSAAELGISLDNVLKAINTQSTRGLGEMGLGIDDVQARVKELTAAGMSMEAAFATATIDAMTAKLEIVGGTSETAEGKMLLLAAAGRELKDNFSTLAFTLFEAAGGIEAVGNAADNLEILNTALAHFQQYKDSGEDISHLIWAMANGDWEKVATEVENLDRASAIATANREYENVSWEEYAFAVRNGLVVTQEMAQAAAGADTAMITVAQAYRDAQTSLEAYGDTAYTAALAQQAMSGIDLDSLNLQIQYQKDAAAAVDLYAAAVSAAMSQGGDYFTQFSQGGEDAFVFADALYATADAHGANLSVLSDVGVQYGIITEQQAAAATEATQTQTIMDHIAAGAQAGVIPWENYAAAVQTAIDKLHGIEEPQIARPLPDRHGGGDAYDENFSEPPIRHEVVEMEVQLQNDLIEDAIAEARGIVEGFTDPAEAYEAIMSMNIEDVVAKAGTVQTLIADIPTEKNITIHVSASGMHILEELRAVGAIP